MEPLAGSSLEWKGWWGHRAIPLPPKADHPPHQQAVPPPSPLPSERVTPQQPPSCQFLNVPFWLLPRGYLSLSAGISGGHASTREVGRLQAVTPHCHGQQRRGSTGQGGPEQAPSLIQHGPPLGLWLGASMCSHEQSNGAPCTRPG